MKQPKKTWVKELTNEEIATRLLTGYWPCKWCFGTGLFYMGGDSITAKCADCSGERYVNAQRIIDRRYSNARQEYIDAGLL